MFSQSRLSRVKDNTIALGAAKSGNPPDPGGDNVGFLRAFCKGSTLEKKASLLPDFHAVARWPPATSLDGRMSKIDLNDTRAVVIVGSDAGGRTLANEFGGARRTA